MPKNQTSNLQRFVSGLTGVLLVFQALLPLVQPGVIRPAMADPVAGEWTFDTVGDYTMTANVSMDGTGGYAVTDLGWTAASDNLDASTGTTDIIQIPTGASTGRLLATVGENRTSRSDDFGNNWAFPADCGLINATLFTDLGAAAGNMLTGGTGVGGAYIGRSLVGDCWTDSTLTGLNATDVAVTDFSSNRLGTVYAVTQDSVTGQVLASLDGGVNWNATVANPGPAILTAVESAGGRIYAGGTGALADTASGIYYSDDNGATWTQALTTTGDNTHSQIKAMYFYSGSKRLFAVTNAGYILQSSGDATVGVPTFTKTSATGAALATDIMVTNLGNGPDIFITLSSGAILRSVNGGTNYFVSSTSLPLGGGNKIIRIDTDASGVADDTFVVAQVNGATGDAYRGSFGSGQAITVNTGIAYSTLTGFTETMGASSEAPGINYQISNDGVTWYWYNGLAWVVATNNTTDVNREGTVDENIGSFDDDHAGSFYFKAIMLTSAPGLSLTNSSIILDKVALGYTAVSVTVTSPNGGEVWIKTTTHNITWNSAGLGVGNIITLSYSLNNGGAWSVIDGTDGAPTANDGTYAWTLPNTTSAQALVRVSANGGAATDQSNGTFNIVNEETGGGCDEENAPTSQTRELEEYHNEVPFAILATAQDDCSGIFGVSLYYTYEEPAGDLGDLIPYGDYNIGCPMDCFAWDFNAPYNDGTYYFYTSAVDNLGNNSYPSKFKGVLDEDNVEAFTTVDTTRPTVTHSSPYLDEEFVPIDGEVTIELSEPVDPATLEYGLFEITEDGTKVDATDKLGALEWEAPSFDLTLAVSYTGLNNDSTYYFIIRSLQDYAGNDLTTNYLEKPDDNPAWIVRFETVAIINPDLTQSKIEIINLPENGKFNPGAVVKFKVTLKNVSDWVSLTTLTLPIAPGLTYCDTAPSCSPAASSSGQAPIVIQDGSDWTVVWTGDVSKFEEVLVTFDVTVDTPAQNLVMTQEAQIDDGLHDEIYVKSVDVELNEVANFSTSTKLGTCLWQGVTQPCTDAVVGTPVTYTITLSNSGTTPVTRTVTDALGNYLDHVAGPTGNGWTSLEYNSVAKAVIGTATFAPGTSKSFTFTATFTNAAAGLSVTNTADIASWSPDPLYTTSVPGISKPEQFPPVIVQESPANDAAGIAELAPIVVAFSKSIDTDTFQYTLTENGVEVNTEDFDISWDGLNGHNNSRATISHPTEPFLLGATYWMEVSYQVTDTDGNTLQPGTLPNPWSWTIADPVVQISSPPEAVVRIGVDVVSPRFVVSIVDQATGAPYIVDTNTAIGLLAEVPGTGDLGKKREISTTARFAASADGQFQPSANDRVFQITVPAGGYQTQFYFRDSIANLVKVIAFDFPGDKGWGDADKGVLVSDVEIIETQPKLVADIPDNTAQIGRLSKPITIRAEAGNRSPVLLPRRIYFYTESTTGAFFNSKFERLPDYVTVAANPTTNLQYASTSGMQAIFYYMDTVAQASMIEISDNAPLGPDTDMVNAVSIMRVVDPGIEIPQELEPVEDETGRILGKLVLTPTQAVLLPGGIKGFAVKALDTKGNVIENAKFKWYVVAGGGTIEKNGIGDTSHESAFTAGDELGSFYDTIIVATIYNGKFDFATASIRVSDIVEYSGPAQLPYTGVSGIQVIFTILTLMAAIALAWVEHYDKTHFEKGT